MSFRSRAIAVQSLSLPTCVDVDTTTINRLSALVVIKFGYARDVGVLWIFEPLQSHTSRLGGSLAWNVRFPQQRTRSVPGRTCTSPDPSQSAVRMRRARESE